MTPRCADLTPGPVDEHERMQPVKPSMSADSPYVRLPDGSSEAGIGAPAPGPDPEASTDPSGGGGRTSGSRPRTSRKKPKPTWAVALEWTILIVSALTIAVLIKTFLFQAFYIPSASMEPTLKIGDRVLVNKLSYDFHDVHRGDIVVFKAPPGERTGGIDDLVKRVIGLPGETVTERQDGNIYINGRRLREPYLPKNTPTRPEASDVPPGCGRPADNSPGCVVPKGRMFVLGDNRTQSKDARTFGPVTESSIVGRVFVRIWPLDDLGFL
jgi:signal peptidase I